jgi:hypothetical protein
MRRHGLARGMWRGRSLRSDQLLDGCREAIERGHDVGKRRCGWAT